MGFKTQENTLCLDKSLGLYTSQIQAEMKPFYFKYCTAVHLIFWLDLLFLTKKKLNQILTHWTKGLSIVQPYLKACKIQVDFLTGAFAS